MDIPRVIGTPETGNLSLDVTSLGREFYSKRGGLGDVIPILAAGIPGARILMPNFKRHFMAQNKMSVDEWNTMRHSTPIGKVHMIDSAYIAGLEHPYSGDVARTAAIFQARGKSILKSIRAEHEGRLVYISNDWLTGGYLSAYLRKRGVPMLHMVHNIHTWAIPIKLLGEGLGDVEVDEFRDLYCYDTMVHDAIDSHATAIKNADYVGVVGHAFLMEIINGEFTDKIPPSVRREIQEKYKVGRALAIPNGLYDELLPEFQDELFRMFEKYGAVQFSPVTEDLIAAKTANKVAFQKATQERRYCNHLKTDENAVLLFWPSRLDEFQKGARLLVDTVWDFVQANPDVQVAVVADPTEGQGQIEKDMKNMAMASDRIFYSRFDKHLSKFGYSACNAVISAPSFEPYGYFIPQGLAAGSLILVTKVGGGKDMVSDYNPFLARGNGIHVEQHTTTAYRQGLDEILAASRHLQRNPEIANREIRRLMVETREHRGSENMIQGYLNVLEALEREYGFR